MFIITEDTPNPAVMKFLPGRDVAGEGNIADYRSYREAETSPLAKMLFAVPNVTGVFFGKDFISVTKAESAEWKNLRTDILEVILDHFIGGEETFALPPEAEKMAVAEEDRETVSQIIELIDTKVRPAVAQDGGDISFHGFKEGTVYLKMKGACAGCPSSAMTLKQGIENMLKHYIPEVEDVQAV